MFYDNNNNNDDDDDDDDDNNSINNNNISLTSECGVKQLRFYIIRNRGSQIFETYSDSSLCLTHLVMEDLVTQ